MSDTAQHQFTMEDIRYALEQNALGKIGNEYGDGFFETNGTDIARQLLARIGELEKSHKLLERLSDNVDMAFEYSTDSRVAWMADACLDALDHLGNKPYGWCSSLASQAFKGGTRYGKPEEEKQ